MKNNTVISGNNIRRRTFIKRATGTMLVFGFGAHAFAASGTLPQHPATCLSGCNDLSVTDKSDGVWKLVCEYAGVDTFPCTLYDNEQCATSKGDAHSTVRYPGVWCVK